MCVCVCVCVYTYRERERERVNSGTSQVAVAVKNLPANVGDIREEGSIPGSGRSPGGGHGNPFQHSCWEKPMDRGAWWTTGPQRVQHDRSDWQGHMCILTLMCL